jgi:hypothetical protein
MPDPAGRIGVIHHRCRTRYTGATPRTAIAPNLSAGEALASRSKPQLLLRLRTTLQSSLARSRARRPSPRCPRNADLTPFAAALTASPARQVVPRKDGTFAVKIDIPGIRPPKDHICCETSHVHYHTSEQIRHISCRMVRRIAITLLDRPKTGEGFPTRR